MTTTKPIGRSVLIASIAIAVVGCACEHGLFCIDKCTDIPRGAIPEEVGTKIHAWQAQQVGGATKDLFTMYVSDYLGDSADLSPAALERLGRITQSGSAQSLPWVVEPSGEPALDQARVNALINALANRNVAPVGVSIATPPALGLAAPQAERIATGAGFNRNAPSNNNLRSTGGFTGGNNFGGAVGGFR